MFSFTELIHCVPLYTTWTANLSSQKRIFLLQRIRHDLSFNKYSQTCLLNPRIQRLCSILSYSQLHAHIVHRYAHRSHSHTSSNNNVHVICLFVTRNMHKQVPFSRQQRHIQPPSMLMTNEKSYTGFSEKPFTSPSNIDTKVRATGAPSYISQHLVQHVVTRQTRSTALPLLTIPRTNTEFVRRSYSYSAPFIWNGLPGDVLNCNSEHTFKKHLKTFLFNSCFYAA